MTVELPVERRYECEECKGATRLLQVDPGRVPAVMECRAHGFYNCPGEAVLTATLKASPDVSVDEIPWEFFNPYRKGSLPSSENAAVASAVYSSLDIRSRRVRAAVAS